MEDIYTLYDRLVKPTLEKQREKIAMAESRKKEREESGTQPVEEDPQCLKTGHYPLGPWAIGKSQDGTKTYAKCGRCKKPYEVGGIHRGYSPIQLNPSPTLF